MSRPFLLKRPACACTAAAGVLALVPVAHAVEPGALHFRLGAIVGLNLSAEFSMQGEFAFAGTSPGPTGVGGVDHVYDDGYVRVDEFGNSGGLSSYWGYNDSAQYDSTAHTLTMHAAKSFDYAGGAITADDAPYLGVDIAYGMVLKQWSKKTRIGVELGVSWLPVKIEDNRTLDVSFVRNVHQFNTTGLDIMPEAPYNGSASGLGPTIHDVATALPDEVGAGQVAGYRALDVNLVHLRLGPTLEYRFHRRWSVLAGIGAAVGIGMGQYDFNETLKLADGSTTIPSTGGIDSTEWSLGGYVNGLVLYRASERAEVFFGAQFLSLTDMKFGDSNRTANLKQGAGVFFTAGFNWFF